MSQTAVTYVVLGFNEADLVERCLRSFLEHMPKGHRVILFDNGSHVSLKKRVESWGISFRRSERNLGFAAGANAALQWAREEYPAEYLAIVNSDVFLHNEYRQQWTQVERRLNKQPNLVAWQPCLYTDAQLTQPENFGILYFSSGIAWQNQGTHRSDVLLNGAFLFLRQEIVDTLLKEDGSVFIPEYFFNAEDVELSLRLVSRGYDIAVIPELQAQHLGAQSTQALSDFSYFHYLRNLWWTIIRCWPSAVILWRFPAIVAGGILLGILSLRKGKIGVFFRALGTLLIQWSWLQQSRHDFQGQVTANFTSYIQPALFSWKQWRR